MASVEIKTISCPKCKAKNQVHIYKSVNAQEDTKIKEKILTGELFDFYCPYCEYRARLYYPCLYNDVKNRFMVYFIPDIEKGQMIDRAVEMEFPNMPRVTKRIVPTFNEFKEKILIFEAGLDDMAMELTKAAVAEAVQRKKEAETAECYFSRYDKENNVLGFTFFLGEDHVPFNQNTKIDVYKKSWNIVSRLGKKERTMKGFIKIDRAWAENILFRYQRFGFDSN